MDIFFAVNDSYCKHVIVTMTSIVVNNPEEDICFHIICNNLSVESKANIEQLKNTKVQVRFYSVDESRFAKCALSIPHITIETYYRYLIPELVPNLTKVLYLDADVIVKGSLSTLWTTDLEGYCLAGVEDPYIELLCYKEKIGLTNEEIYVNAGVLLLNLQEWRVLDKTKELFSVTEEIGKNLLFQDQDVINLVFRGRIKAVSSLYNFTSRHVANSDQIELDNAIVIHYTGKKKPWTHFFCSGNPGERYYFQFLRISPLKNDFWTYLLNPLKLLQMTYYMWKKQIKSLAQLIKRKIPISVPFQTYQVTNNFAENKKLKVALLVDEFFGGDGTAFGGYGFLARHYLAKYIPNKEIQVDVLLKFARKLKCTRVDDVDVYRLPSDRKKARKWLNAQNYDVYLSIELTSASCKILQLDGKRKNLVLWIQDPRPWYEWREINTVKMFPEHCYWDTEVYEYVHQLVQAGKVHFLSQGYFLNDKAKDLYRLNNDHPIQYLPNPINQDMEFDVDTYHKKDQIIFLGRIESVKRGWLFCEIAKRLPNYEFFMLGQTFREKEKNQEIIAKYGQIPNLHFVGHVEGEQKAQFLKDSKILVNTSIHEALPISFLEALAYGTLIVSNRNPENLASKFGVWVGDVLGDGFDKVDLYVNAIQEILEHDEQRSTKAKLAVSYVRDVHNTERIIENLRDVLHTVAKK